MILWIWLVVTIAALTLYFKQLYSKFSRHGVKNFRPYPVVGTSVRFLLRLEHMADDLMRNYKTFNKERFVGRYDFITPILMINDVELVKKITIKDFEHFLDHRTFVDEKKDPLFGRNIFSMKGREWKDMRSTLSPAFTSSKIKLMLPLMVEVGNQMVASLKKEIKESGEGSIDIDCKDLTTRYANDVIASCAFGLKVDSHSDKDNQFYAMGKTASTFNFKQLIMFFAMLSFPKIIKILNFSLFTEATKAFFRDIVLNTMKDREARHIVRPDMINLLMEAKKGQLSHDEKSNDTDAGFATVEESSVGKKNVNRVWADDDLVAQATLFFIAGFETASSAMSFLLHELAVNPDVQDKLYQEIRTNDAKNQGKFDYKSIQHMVYLDMVVSELLRMWPPGLALDRVCTKDYNLGKPNDEATEDYIVRKGDGIQIPVWCFHRDPNFFPNPAKFDPERFSEENKHTINPLAYIPFGAGPRNCIGSRFALCEIKVLVYQLLQAVEVSPSAKTLLPASLSTDTFNIRMKGGHWLSMKIRS